MKTENQSHSEMETEMEMRRRERDYVCVWEYGDETDWKREQEK